MNSNHYLPFILVLAFATLLTRALPFLLFGKKGKTPAVIVYLGKVLPAAMMGLLVVYCFKDVNVTDVRALVPLVCACAAVIGVHLWKRNTMLSIAVGTVLYMVLIRVL